MANNIDIKDFTLGTARTMKTIETAGVNVPLHAIDQTTDGTTNLVRVPPTTKVSANFNRPADTTAYAVNDAVADNVTAGSVTKLSFAIARGAGTVRRVKISKSNAAVATPLIRLWLFDATFTAGAGDNAAFAFPAANAIGYVDVAVTNAGSDIASGWTAVDIPFSSSNLFGVLQTLSIFTPASAETFTVDLTYAPG